ncbi:hypothetical protein [Actibacterium ureilyticum]|uniref:hypothetical protein n=1 Tax=Actibacterium ureilyticum TaxID=1590614 RepID=UPI001FE48258|nr:hypothetical protein [Actibacterium ureilyticum]
MRLADLLRGAGLCLAMGAAGWAADFSDPTWPCVQRKVETLSPGLMWPHPITEMTLDAATLDDVRDLSERLSLRRLELAEIQPEIDRFVTSHGSDPALLGQVFDRVFTRLSRTRTAIIRGIGDYSLEQIRLSEQIEAKRQSFDAALAAEPPDYDAADEIEAQIDWDERIYQDRQRSLTYVCETPVLLEKRLFGVAQMLIQATGG